MMQHESARQTLVHRPDAGAAGQVVARPDAAVKQQEVQEVGRAARPCMRKPAHQPGDGQRGQAGDGEMDGRLLQQAPVILLPNHGSPGKSGTENCAKRHLNDNCCQFVSEPLCQSRHAGIIVPVSNHQRNSDGYQIANHNSAQQPYKNSGK